LKGTELYEEVKQATGGDEILIYSPEKNECVLKKVGQYCIFLDENKLCKIHSRYNSQAKSITCRQFPFIIGPTPDGIYIGADFTCQSVLEDTGKSIEEFHEEIDEYISTFKYFKYGSGPVYLFDGISTDWNGYLRIDEFISKVLDSDQPIAEALWRSFMTLSILYISSKRQGLNNLTAEYISDFLNTPREFPFERDESHIWQENQYAIHMIVLLESVDKAGLNSMVDAINTTGGEFYSSTFKQNIRFDQLSLYMDTHKTPDDILVRYIKHAVFRKFLLRSDNILVGLSILSLSMPFYKWFCYASAFTRKVEQPEQEDAYKSIKIVETFVRHNNTGVYVKNARAFCESFFKQVEIYN
jgi:Fe-S-cluster containining protein